MSEPTGLSLSLSLSLYTGLLLAQPQRDIHTRHFRCPPLSGLDDEGGSAEISIPALLQHGNVRRQGSGARSTTYYLVYYFVSESSNAKSLYLQMYNRGKVPVGLTRPRSCTIDAFALASGCSS